MPEQFTSKPSASKFVTVPIGTKFGKWTITGPPVSNKGRNYPIRCECGTERLARIKDVRKLNACYRCTRSRIIHGCGRIGKKTRLFNIWMGMKKRCTNSKDQHYALYGGKGIRVCDEWQEFIPFRDWSIANGYTDHLTIDRKDSNRDYEPNNCRWATTAEQARNIPSRNVWITAFGETKVLADWFIDPRCTICKTTYKKRILKGWTPYNAVFTAPQSSTFGAVRLDPNGLPMAEKSTE